MNSISNELVVLLFLLLINGIFALAEAALGAARKSRLRELADNGDKRAQAALDIIGEPSKLLAAIRFSITFFTVLAGARAGGAVAERIDVMITEAILLLPIAPLVSLALRFLGVTLAAVLMALGVTLAVVLVAELFPRRLALWNPERFAMLLVRPMRIISFVVNPMIAGLSVVADLLLWPFGLHRAPKEAPVTEEEVNTLVEEGMKGGVFNEMERNMVAGVLELDEMPISYLTTPRPKLVFLDLDDPDGTNWRKVVASGHSHFPVVEGNKEHVLGMVSVKGIWANHAFGAATALRNLITPALLVPETMMTSAVLEQFKLSGKHIALVNDEFGSLAGVVSLYDVLEAIVGDIPESGRRDEPAVTPRPDGSLLIDAAYDIDEFKEMSELSDLPHEEETEFQTLGGFVVTHFGRIPATGEAFDHEGWRFEVVDMDRHRVDKLLVTPPAKVDENKAAADG